NVAEVRAHPKGVVLLTADLADKPGSRFAKLTKPGADGASSSSAASASSATSSSSGGAASSSGASDSSK
ncbi:MAG TPA: S41 family peptidase, partial [Asticcacaulis sp.]